MTETARNSSPLHAAHCGVWDLPDTADVEAILEAGYGDEPTARYLALVRPVYDTYARVLAQLAGIFLLQSALSHSPKGGLPLDHAMFGIARDQCDEATEKLRSLTAPETATRHKSALRDLATHLSRAMAAMDRLATSLSATDKTHLHQETLTALHAAQRLLIACAEPDARITPVDFSHACCTCGGLATG